MTALIIGIVAILIIAAVAHYVTLPGRYDVRRDK